ncbi:MAG: hypothetical protein HOV66_04670 [Streptomycetaceae bacterium]|nr:hypothetical protein [Streptomycetaceae bacterium]
MFRLEPNMPAHAYQTFQIASPIETHWRPATCEEYGCEQYASGWRVRVEGLSAADLHAIRTSGRRCRQVDVAEGETWFVFEPGQACFQAPTHKVPLGRPELFVVRGGDVRGNPTGDSYQHSSAESWVDDFATHQDKIARVVEKG